MPLDDAQRVETLLDDCIRRGLVERAGDDVRPSRVWKGWLTKAAEVLNRQVQQTGRQPEGHAIALAVEKALAMKGEGVPDAERADYVALLTLLELADMPEAKRAQYGPYP